MSRADVLTAAQQLTAETGWPPTERQVARLAGCAPSTAHVHIAELRRQGCYRFRLVSVPSRTCGLSDCVTPLDGYRSDAVYCCDAHRAEASRRRRMLLVHEEAA